jgi:hypothetical protein
MGNTENATKTDNPRVESRRFFGLGGFALLLSWIFSLMHSSVYLALDYRGDAFLFRELFICAALVMAVVVWLVYHFFSLSNTTVTVLFSIAAMPAVSEFFGVLGMVPYSVLAILWLFAGAGTSVLFVFWGLTFSALDYREAIFFPAIGIAVAVIIATLTSLFPPVITAVLTMSFPILSVLFYFLARPCHESNSSNSSFIEMGFLNGGSKIGQRQQLLISTVVTVINSACMGFASQYFFHLHFF